MTNPFEEHIPDIRAMTLYHSFVGSELYAEYEAPITVCWWGNLSSIKVGSMCWRWLINFLGSVRPSCYYTGEIHSFTGEIFCNWISSTLGLTGMKVDV